NDLEGPRQTKTRRPIGLHPGDVLAVELDVASRRGRHACHDDAQRGPARAVRPDQADHFTLVHRARDVSQRLKPGEAARDRLQVKNLRHSSPSPTTASRAATSAHAAGTATEEQ